MGILNPNPEAALHIGSTTSSQDAIIDGTLYVDNDICDWNGTVASSTNCVSLSTLVSSSGGGGGGSSSSSNTRWTDFNADYTLGGGSDFIANYPFGSTHDPEPYVLNDVITTNGSTNITLNSQSLVNGFNSYADNIGIGIDPATVSLGAGANNLDLRVNSNVGAQNYCDRNNANCNTPADMKTVLDLFCTAPGSCSSSNFTGASYFKSYTNTTSNINGVYFYNRDNNTSASVETVVIGDTNVENAYVDEDIILDVQGPMGAEIYCDQEGGNCVYPNSLFKLVDNSNTCSDGQLLTWNNTNSNWECTDGSSLVTSGKWSETTDYATSGNIFYNPSSGTEKYVGIGTEFPDSLVHLDSGVSGPTITAEYSATSDQDVVFALEALWDTGSAANPIAGISMLAGDDTTDKDNGLIAFSTASGNSVAQERMRIDEEGNVMIGTTTPAPGTMLTVYGDIEGNTYYYSSDRRLKKDITPLQSALEKVTQLRGVLFKWKDSDKEDIGFVAQEVEEVFPELVNGTDKKSVKYGNITAILVEAIKEQQEQIEELKAELEALKE